MDYLDTNTFWALRGNYEQTCQQLGTADRKLLEAIIIDKRYNEFLAGRSDDGNDKRVPYIGWFWRHVSFHCPERVPIGDCGEFIGFMENNKWDYPERYLTRDEFDKMMGIIDAAMEANRQGGILSEIEKNVDDKLKELWDWFQTLKIEPN